MDSLDRRFSVAPMMEWTDRWCRRLHRSMSTRALLFTEMVTADAVLRGDLDRLLGWDPAREGAVVLQLGGSEPAKLAAAARLGADFGYAEINLNVGCPSDRVQEGRFGACLMREPERVAACVAAMRDAVSIPITVKCRIGVDDDEPEAALFGFVEAVARAGCEVFYVHARKAWLQGLSPKENRERPPLDYGLVRRLKAARPKLSIILNGGLKSLDQAIVESAGLDGVMLGRAAYETPYDVLAEVDARVFGDAAPNVSREAVVEDLKASVADAVAAGRNAHAVTRHALGLFHGSPGARSWRRVLAAEAVKPGAGPEVVDTAIGAMRARRSALADAPS